MIGLNYDSEISPILPLIYRGGSKMRNLAYEVMWFRNGTAYDGPMIF